MHFPSEGFGDFEAAINWRTYAHSPRRHPRTRLLTRSRRSILHASAGRLRCGNLQARIALRRYGPRLGAAIRRRGIPLLPRPEPRETRHFHRLEAARRPRTLPAPDRPDGRAAGELPARSDGSTRARLRSGAP